MKTEAAPRSMGQSLEDAGVRAASLDCVKDTDRCFHCEHGTRDGAKGKSLWQDPRTKL